jgi:hypothetical protein
MSFATATRLNFSACPCPAPTLHIARDAAPDKVLLRWSTAVPGFQLEAVDGIIDPPLPFQDESNAVTILNGRYIVTNNVTGSQRVYRLRR